MNAYAQRTPQYRGPKPAALHQDENWPAYYHDPKLAVVCVYWGDKYPIDYVRKLRDAVARNLKGIPYDFYCVSSDARVEQFGGVTRLEPRTDKPGWWQKIGLFAEGLIPACREPVNHAYDGMYHCEGCGTMVVPFFPHPPRAVLYLDLDVVIRSMLMPLLRCVIPCNGLVMAENFGPNKPQAAHNSSVMLWFVDTCTEIYNDFDNSVMQTLHGDQCWIWRRKENDIKEFPTTLVRSYKYDVMPTGVPPKDAAVIIFHGKPDPHEVQAAWISEHWK